MERIMIKPKVKMIVDIAMSIVLFVLMSYQFTEQKNHEIAGAVMLVLFLLHHVLNYKWYVTLVKGKYPLQRCLQIVVDLVLFVIMLILMISGIGMSRYIFRFFNFVMSAALARQLHMIYSYTCFLLLGFHLGLHFGMIQVKMRKMLHLQGSSPVRTWTSRGIVTAISIYGIYALIKRNFISYITLKMHFVFFDYEEPIIFYELDLLAIMILMIYIGYYLQRVLIQLEKRKRRD